MARGVWRDGDEEAGPVVIPASLVESINRPRNRRRVTADGETVRRMSADLRWIARKRAELRWWAGVLGVVALVEAVMVLGALVVLGSR